MSDKSVSRREALKGIAATAVGAAILGQVMPAEAYQPHMQAALKALNNASNQLNMALADKAGHRVRALKLVGDAIAEVQAGIAAGA